MRLQRPRLTLVHLLVAYIQTIQSWPSLTSPRLVRRIITIVTLTNRLVGITDPRHPLCPKSAEVEVAVHTWFRCGSGWCAVLYKIRMQRQTIPSFDSPLSESNPRPQRNRKMSIGKSPEVVAAIAAQASLNPVGILGIWCVSVWLFHDLILTAMYISHFRRQLASYTGVFFLVGSGGNPTTRAEVD